MPIKILISQSMYFPWLGFLEQIQLADVYVRYDDVQFSKGSFTNRVQIKTADGTRWLTVPLPGLHLGQHIQDVQLAGETDWQKKHMDQLNQAYREAPYLQDMLNLVQSVFAQPAHTISDIAFASVMGLANFFCLNPNLKVIDVGTLSIAGSGSNRVLEIVKTLGGSVYITGHGARNYLDHESFEDAGIAVKYMQYSNLAYPQLHGAFTPYVSALDLVANCGRDGKRYIQPNTIDWKEFLRGTK